VAAFTILPTATRQAGRTRTVSATVPPPPENTGFFRLELAGLALQDEPPDTEILISLDRSADGGQTWTPMGTVRWNGNNGAPFRFPPHLTVSVDQLVGQAVSADFTTNKRLRYGVTGEWVTLT